MPLRILSVSRFLVPLSIGLAISSPSIASAQIPSIQVNLAQTQTDGQHAATLLDQCQANVQQTIPPPIDNRLWVGQGEEYEASLQPCHEALVLYRQKRDRPNEAQVLDHLGFAYIHLLDNYLEGFESEQRATYFKQAVEVLQAALVIYQDLSDGATPPQEDYRAQAAKTLYRLGYAHREMRQYEESLTHLTQAVERYQAIDFAALDDADAVRNTYTATYIQLGLVYRALDDYEQAIATFNQAITQAQAATLRDQEAAALFQLGVTYRIIDQESEALAALERYVAVVGDAQGALAQADALQKLGGYYTQDQRRLLLDMGAPSPLDRSPFDNGIDFYQRALEIYQSLDQLDQQAVTLSSMGSGYYRQQRYQDAFQLHLQALDVASRMEDRDRQAQILDYPIGEDISKYQLEQTEQALQLQQRILEIYQAAGDRHLEAQTLSLMGHIYYVAGQYKEALEFRQQAYSIYRELEDLQAQARILNAIGFSYLQRGVSTIYLDTPCISQGQYDRALQFYSQAIALSQRLIDQTTGDERVTHQIDLAYRLQEVAGDSSLYACQHAQAIAFYQQARDIYQQLGDQENEIRMIESMGDQALRIEQYDRAVAWHQEALDGYQQLYPWQGPSRVLSLVHRYRAAGAFEQAISFSQQAVAIAQSESPSSQAGALASLAETYRNIASQKQRMALQAEFPSITDDELEVLLAQRPLSQDYLDAHTEAIALYQQAFTIHQQSESDLYETVEVLMEIGWTYYWMRQSPQAQVFFDRALALIRQQGDPYYEARILERLGGWQLNQEHYDAALSLFQQALAIYQDPIHQEAAESVIAIADSYSVLVDLGRTYRQMEQYDQALQAYEQAYQLDTNRIWILRNKGEIALEAGYFQQALAYFQQELDTLQVQEDRHEEQLALAAIGSIYLKQGDLNQALAFHEPYLELIQEKGDRPTDVESLLELGQHYQYHGYPEQALSFYQRALAISTALQQEADFQFFDGAGTSLSAMGDVLVEQEEADLAIVFYKAAIKNYEDIRSQYVGSDLVSDADFSGLFLGTRTEVYRTLADLLLQRDRILEAQQVLDLLKIQELDDYLGDRPGDVQRSVAGGSDPNVTLRQPEQSIFQRFEAKQEQFISLGQELATLTAINRQDRTEAQRDRISQLRQLQQDSRFVFQSFLDQPDVKALVAQLRQTTAAVNLELGQLNALQDNLQRLDQNAVVIYPLVLDDRIELVLTTADSPPIRRTSAIARTDLNQLITEFRQALSRPSSDPRIPAKQLYDILIRPIEADLAQANADTLIYAPDGPLRYIPLAALYDGQQWLVERYQINNITASSLDSFDDKPFNEPLDILAAAFSGQQRVVLSDSRTQSFDALPYAKPEVESLAQLIPQTETRFDQDFSADVVFEMDDFNVVHLATHAAFNPGPPEDSFILFGDGSRATLTDIRTWTFPNVELIVLSACETAVGDVALGNGEEILGFGYLMQEAGAEAAIASLWPVSDGGTQLLMESFYTAFSNGYTKAESLQRAQQFLITGDSTLLESAQDTAETPLAPSASSIAKTNRRISHPYYWAPFILIGNGL
ncbi:MAG: tetratricopeptide repeat protein [Cyanobacteria bacterium P01_F01_bin.150]